MDPAKTVLFVCEFNSCRSQLAEALARKMFPTGWRPRSAGLTRTVVSEEVFAALRETNVDSAGLRSKSLEEIEAASVDEVVVLAPPAAGAVRARFPAARILEWPMDDPIRAPGGPDAVRAAVRAARDELSRRLTAWLDGGASP